MAKRIDRRMLVKAERDDHHKRGMRSQQRQRRMSVKERMGMLERVVLELREKMETYTDPEAIAFTERVIAQAEREIGELKAKEPKG